MSPKIERITLVRNANEFQTNFGVVRMDDLPSDFLVSPGLQETAIDSTVVLEKLSTILKNTVTIQSDALLPSYDTDFVVLVQYSESRVDTIGVSFDVNRPIIIGQQLFKNSELSKYLIELLCNTDGYLKEYIDDCYYKDKFSYFGKPKFSSTNALSPDYGIFTGTSLESLAIEMMRGDTIVSRKLIENDPALLKNAYDDYRDIYLYSIGKGPLLITSCIKYQQNDMLRLLLSLGADPEQTDGFNGEYTALMVACENSHLMESAFILIDAGAKVDSPTYGITPLQVCIINRNFRMAEFLVRHGARIETENNRGQNAFDLAVLRRYYKMAYLFTLLGYKTDTIKQFNGSLTPIVDYIESHPSRIPSDIEYSQRLLQVLRER